MVITVLSPMQSNMWESRDEPGFPGHGAHDGAGFQKGSTCSNRQGDCFGWIFKGLQLSSQYDPTRPTPFDYLPVHYRAELLGKSSPNLIGHARLRLLPKQTDLLRVADLIS